ncbi:SRPBCC family protein [Salinisphaera sp. LB1]|uniref:SRPBCC family protein n=1 Tax=Salinisphaera sp. LB1 TaxID=2183911 RepID=UPI000D706A8F|nr:SRPBCC family protein [Salinisphaera sp. LB1]AWN17323.1 XoxI [Salinisphaera sp. LB1]
MKHKTTALLLLPLIAGSALAAGSDAGSKPTPTLHESDSVTIAAAPDIVWSTVRDYDAPSVWDPFITSTTLTHGKNNKPGAKRHMTTADGSTIDDTLTAWNADKRMFATRMIHTDMPLRHYRDRVEVEATASGSRLIWQARFQPAAGAVPGKVRAMVKHRITQALAHVKAMLGTRSGASKPNTAGSTTTAAPSPSQS